MIATITSECTILILQKYGFKVCVILFGFYSTHFKVYIYLPFINTQWQTRSPFDDTSIISSSNHWKTVLYQGSSYCFEGDGNSDIIRLLEKSQSIHYCNQSVLAIVQYQIIFVFSITIVDLISRSDLLLFSLLRESYLYNPTGLGCYIYTV